MYEEAERSFAEGDRIQLTAPHKPTGLANRELGTQLTSSLERQFDKTAAVHDRDVVARQENAVNDNAKAAAIPTSHAEQQGQSAHSSSTGREFGHGR